MNLHDVSISLFLSTFAALTSILHKAESHDSSRIDPTTARIAPDMLPLTFQIQACARTAISVHERIGGASPPSDLQYKETTWAELYALIEKTVAFLETASREAYQGKDEEMFRWKGGRGEEQSAGGLEYVTGYAIPNFMFHAVTAFDICRMEGVGIGKKDWQGRA